jgi:hypothetical protein
MGDGKRPRYLFERIIVDVAEFAGDGGAVWRCAKWHRSGPDLHPLRIALDYGMGGPPAVHIVCPVCFVVALPDMAMFEHRTGTL